jgi:hypothetical protein
VNGKSKAQVFSALCGSASGGNLITPAVGCLFPKGLTATWCRHGDTVTDADRARQVEWYGRQWVGMPNTRYIQTLLTAYADDCPIKINLFQNGNLWGRKYDYGCDLNYAKCSVVREDARMIQNAGALWIPHLFCDDKSIYALDDSIHERAIDLLFGQFGPYCKIISIGLESTEYLDLTAHDKFAAMIRKYAPNHIIATHMAYGWSKAKEKSYQTEYMVLSVSNRPRRRLEFSPLPNIQLLFAELPWSPTEGNEHTPEEAAEVSAQIIEAAKAQGVTTVISEVNTDVEGETSRRQNQLIYKISGCAGIAGPV